SVGFTTADELVHELMEARDERRLLRLQKQMDTSRFVIARMVEAEVDVVDVGLSPIGDAIRLMGASLGVWFRALPYAAAALFSQNRYLLRL
ncbi:MAG: hypothetical protein ACSLE4_12900, partial [Methyloceanibacter sp.]